MREKSEIEKIESEMDIAKIWCPDGENFQYVKVCEAHCKKKDRCKPIRDYFEPNLFSSDKF